MKYKLKTKTQATRLTAMAKIGAGKPAARPRQCRICLADETFGKHPFRPGDVVSSLHNGICADRAACEDRQPPLIALDELT